MKISRAATGLFALALLAFIATDVMAQRGGGRPGGDGGRQGGGGGGRGGPGGGGGFGGGGFGGGRGGGGGGDAVAGLLRIEEVREEIELMPDQEEALEKIASNRGNQERPNFDFRNASEEERNEFFEKMRKQRDEATAKARAQLEEILLPEQLDRLDQIALQQRGVGALMDEKVIKTLKISTAQTANLKKVGEGMQEKMMSRMADLRESGDREKMFEGMTKARDELKKEADKGMMDVLTADQKKQFEDMKGEPFEMPESARRGGGRGGAGGGGRGGAGGGGRGGAGGGGRGGGADRGGDRGGRGGGDRGGRGGRPAAEE
ncbi:hypothetical protein [Stieleria marina]|uniref:Periplasmic repressor CpxP n=1 Tax=Stieleria marina TaxID=1930275 RepID=A0A517NPL6_9BACT|nr:hypothetical protein K239x_10090 [Planctomycetes bacterium K23_9]